VLRKQDLCNKTHSSKNEFDFILNICSAWVGAEMLSSRLSRHWYRVNQRGQGKW